jgi:hypothetical protein
MVPIVYDGYRRDSQNKRDFVRNSDAMRLGTSDNGVTQITRHLLDNDIVYNTDFRFEEIWNLEVLGLVDNGIGLESSNAQDASVVEDVKRLEVMQSFINNEGPRPLKDCEFHPKFRAFKMHKFCPSKIKMSSNNKMNIYVPSPYELRRPRNYQEVMLETYMMARTIPSLIKYLGMPSTTFLPLFQNEESRPRNPRELKH